ncbi:MAG: hypothetical protein V1799_17370 [bacterium]
MICIGAESNIERGILYLLVPAGYAIPAYLVGGFIGLIFDLVAKDSVYDFTNLDAINKTRVLKELMWRQNKGKRKPLNQHPAKQDTQIPAPPRTLELAETLYGKRMSNNDSRQS